MKKQIELLLRRLGLERLIFYYVYLKDHKKNKSASEAFEKRHRAFKFPPPFLRFDVIATSSASYFYESGKLTAEQISLDLKRYAPETTPVRVLEWGCGPGRLLQHMQSYIPERNLELSGVDMYQPSIQWASDNLSDVAVFHRNEKAPPLIFDQDEFDFVYALSVFTHLSEKLSRVWMTEIMRILKPGGVFWFSSHSGDHHHSKLNEEDRERLGHGQYVAIHSFHDGSQMFEGIHPPQYMEQLLVDAGGEVVRYQPSGLQGYQDVWIVKKTDQG